MKEIFLNIGDVVIFLSQGIICARIITGIQERIALTTNGVLFYDDLAALKRVLRLDTADAVVRKATERKKPGEPRFRFEVTAVPEQKDLVFFCKNGLLTRSAVAKVNGNEIMTRGGNRLEFSEAVFVRVHKL